MKLVTVQRRQIITIIKLIPTIHADITITSIATDDNVTGPDSEHTQAIIGTVSGDVKAGDIVTVTLDGQQLGTAEVQADKSWRLSVDGRTLLDAKADNVTATVTATDAAGNSQTANGSTRLQC